MQVVAQAVVMRKLRMFMSPPCKSRWHWSERCSDAVSCEVQKKHHCSKKRSQGADPGRRGLSTGCPKGRGGIDASSKREQLSRVLELDRECRVCVSNHPMLEP